jgi:uncharacterized membrane protein
MRLDNPEFFDYVDAALFQPPFITNCRPLFSSVQMNIPRATYSSILAGAALWCAALVIAPILDASSLFVWAGVVREFFNRICHQLDARSFHLLGHPLAVCSRCASIYFAFLFGVMVYPLLRSLESPILPPRFWLVIAITPMVLDVVADMAGIHEATNMTRAFTGTLFGLIIPYFIIPAAIEAVRQLFRSHSSLSNTITQKG